MIRKPLTNFTNLVIVVESVEHSIKVGKNTSVTTKNSTQKKNFMVKKKGKIPQVKAKMELNF